MKKNAPLAGTSGTSDLVTEEIAKSGSVEASLMDDIVANGGSSITPVESAILCLDQNLETAMGLIKEIKNHTAMLETACKLMRYELNIISKNLTKKE